MNNLTLAVQTIKDSVSALDVGQAIGLNIDRHGRCSCPFHNGHDRNLKLFPGDRGYSCFVCHDSGDVIKFVRQYYNMQFKDAVRWFNSMFNLGMDIDSPIDPEAEKRALLAQKRRVREREDLEWKERARFEMYLLASDMVSGLEEQRDLNVPKSADEQ